MAEEKMNTGQGDQLTIEPSDTPAPGHELPQIVRTAQKAPYVGSIKF